MGKISVNIMDVTGNKQQKALLPDDVPASKIITKLVSMMNLPENGPDGLPLNYKFHHKSSGKQLQENQTLSEVGVKDGDTLRLQPEITAG